MEGFGLGSKLGFPPKGTLGGAKSVIARRSGGCERRSDWKKNGVSQSTIAEPSIYTLREDLNFGVLEDVS